jgi:phosphatidylglycerophosphate synthase
MGMKMIIDDFKVDSESCFFVKLKSQLVLNFFIELLKEVPFKEVIFRTEEVDKTRQFVEANLGQGAGLQVVKSIRSYADALVLKANLIYHKKKLIRLIKKGGTDFSSAVLWEIKNKSDLKNAEDTMERIEKYPIARYINLQLGKRLANFFARLGFSPNQLTLISLIIGIVASFCLASNVYVFLVLGAVFIQLHCTLDFADGHLARLKGLSSGYGAFWDGVVNKIVESLCYIGVTYGLIVKYNNKLFFIVGLFVILGRFMIEYVNFVKNQYLADDSEPSYQIDNRKSAFKIFKKIYWFLEQWDVRLYIISIFAILNKLEIAIIYFVLDFNSRWIFNVVKIILGKRKNP